MNSDVASQRIYVALVIGQYLEGKITVQQALEKMPDLTVVRDPSIDSVDAAFQHIKIAESKQKPDVRWVRTEQLRLGKMRRFLELGQSAEDDEFAMGVNLVKTPSRREFRIRTVIGWLFILCILAGTIWLFIAWDGPQWVKGLIGLFVATGGSLLSVKEMFQSYESAVKQIEQDNKKIREATTKRREMCPWERYQNDDSPSA